MNWKDTCEKCELYTTLEKMRQLRMGVLGHNFVNWMKSA